MKVDINHTRKKYEYDHHRALEIGKAGEHLVVADLLISGYNAFLTDKGNSHDIIFETKDGFKTIEVRSTLTSYTYKGKDFKKDMYIFHLKKGRGSTKRFKKIPDYLALCVISKNLIAYIPTIQLMRDGKMIMVIQFRDKNENGLKGRMYSNGKVRTLTWSKYLQDYPMNEELPQG